MVSYTTGFKSNSLVVSISKSCKTHLTMICLNIRRLSFSCMLWPFCIFLAASSGVAKGAGTSVCGSTRSWELASWKNKQSRKDILETSGDSIALDVSISTRKLSSKSWCGVVVLNSRTKVVTIRSHFSGLSFRTLLSNNCWKHEVPIRARVSFSVEICISNTFSKRLGGWPWQMHTHNRSSNPSKNRSRMSK